MSSTTGQPRNRRYIRVSQQTKTKLRWPENSTCIEHQNVHRRRSSCSSASIYIRVYTSEADVHKPGIYEECEYGLTSGTCFIARRLEVVTVAGLLWIYFVVCFFSVWWDLVFFFSFLLRSHMVYCKYEATSCLIYLSTSNEARPRERSDRGRFLLLGQKSLFIPGRVQGAII